MPPIIDKAKDLFVLKQFTLGNVSGLLVDMENSGIIKISYTETEVQITLWDSTAKHIIHTYTCKHTDLLPIEEKA